MKFTPKDFSARQRIRFWRKRDVEDETGEVIMVDKVSGILICRLKNGMTYFASVENVIEIINDPAKEDPNYGYKLEKERTGW